MSLTSITRLALMIILSLACFLNLFHRITTFISRPLGTQVSTQSVLSGDIPVLSICPRPSINISALVNFPSMTSDKLENMQLGNGPIFFINDFGIVIEDEGLNSRQTLDLYHLLMFQSKEIISNIVARTQEGEDIDLEEIDSVMPLSELGLCPTFAVPTGMSGIQEIMVNFLPSKLSTSWQVYLFSHGWFYESREYPGIEHVTVNTNQSVQVLIDLKKTSALPLDNFFYKLGDYPSCNNSEDQNLDLQITNIFHQNFTDQHSCVLPFWSGDHFSETDNVPICSKLTSSQTSLLYNQTMGNKLLESSLDSIKLRPCSKIKVNYGLLHIQDGTPETKLSIKLPRNIQLEKEYITYVIGDLTGDIGGYMGLFLGFSLFTCLVDTVTFGWKLRFFCSKSKRKITKNYVDHIV